MNTSQIFGLVFLGLYILGFLWFIRCLITAPQDPNERQYSDAELKELEQTIRHNMGLK
jgi:hypothetical protein